MARAPATNGPESPLLSTPSHAMQASLVCSRSSPRLLALSKKLEAVEDNQVSQTLVGKLDAIEGNQLLRSCRKRLRV
jgi:hypothetical protein